MREDNRNDHVCWVGHRHPAKRRPWHLLARALRGHQELHRRLQERIPALQVSDPRRHD